MGDNKRPSTSSLRRFITSRPYVTIAEIRRRFGLDAEEAMTRVALNGTSGYVGLPEREALKLEELWSRGEIGLEFSAEVRAPVVVGVYPMRIARFVMDGTHRGVNGDQAVSAGADLSDGGERPPARPAVPARPTPATPMTPSAPRVDAGRGPGAPGVPLPRSSRRRFERRPRR